MNQRMQQDIDRAADLILNAKYVGALTGAGVSVESGIRPYRGPDGLWTEYGEPPMDRYQQFFSDPKVGWDRIMKGEMFPREMMSKLVETLVNARPNDGHYALAELEDMGILKFLITQNVDNLHRAAGARNLLEIHGNLYKLRCMQCNSRYEFGEISLQATPPICPKCRGTVKPDGVMFGEPIPTDVLGKCQEETSRCDCMLSVGTSALVYPAASFPQIVKRKGGSLIEINAYGTDMGSMCDIAIEGKSAEIMPVLLGKLKLQLGR